MGLRKGDAMESKRTRDMTSGSPAKHIFLFSLPLLAGNVLQQMYNMVDSWVVGRFTGDTALAAVGIAFPVIFLFVSLFIGLGIGSTVVIAQFYGAKEMARVRAAIDTTYGAFLVIALPVSVLAFLLADPLLQLLQVQADAFPEAKLYLQIISLGLIGSIGYNTNAGILQGLGNSKTPLLFLLIATIINIVLDLVFVAFFDWGVVGVAFATLIAEWFSWFFGIFYINKKYKEFKLHIRGIRIDRRLLYKIARIGLPAGIQNALIAVASMAMTSKVNTFGTDVMAGFNVGSKIDCFALFPIQSFCNAVTTFVGQNVGAGRMDRVRSGMWATMGMSLGWSIIAAATLIPLARPLLSLFSKTPAVIDVGANYLYWILPGFVLFSIMFVLTNVMRGAGSSIFPMINSLLSVVVIRVGLCYYLADTFGQEYMFGCYAGGWVLGVAMAMAYYLSGRWKRFATTTMEELGTKTLSTE